MYIYLPIATYCPGAERDFKYPVVGICFGGALCRPSRNMWGCGAWPFVLSVGFEILLA